MEAEAPLAVSFRSCFFFPVSSGSGWGQDVGLAGTGLTSQIPSSISISSSSTWRLEGGPGLQHGGEQVPPRQPAQGGSWGWARSQLRLRAYLSMSPAKEELSWGRGGWGGE